MWKIYLIIHFYLIFLCVISVGHQPLSLSPCCQLTSRDERTTTRHDDDEDDKFCCEMRDEDERDSGTGSLRLTAVSRQGSLRQERQISLSRTDSLRQERLHSVLRTGSLRQERQHFVTRTGSQQRQERPRSVSFN